MVNVMGPDSAVPGVNKAVLKKGGKGGAGELNAAQIDPTKALNYFQSAANTLKQYSNKGLGMYNTAMEQAMGQLKPYADAGVASTNEYMKMLGLPGTDGQPGYTGEQLTAKLENTPGYQFQLQQGTQATARNALASGGISGNTLAASQNYGQQLAQGTYQNYLSNLGAMSAQGQQASTNLSNLYGQQGTTQLNTMQGIGQGYYNAGMQQGNTWYNAAAANMAAQNEVMAQQRAIDAQAANAAMSAGAGYMNAATNQAQFNYGVFQNQQGGQSFYGGAKTGWPSYNPNSNSWAV